MRFSVKTRAVKRFVSQFVHAGVVAGSDEHERHRQFLTFSGLASGCLLGLVPLVVAGNHAKPGLWAATAAVAALPFFLGILVSRTGRLDAALNVLTLSVAAGLGLAIAITGGSLTPLILIAALTCIEPTLWRMRRPVAKGAKMAIVAAATVLVWGTAVQPVAEVSLLSSVVLWITAAAYLASVVTRIALGRTRIEAKARRDAAFCDLLSANTKDLITTHRRNGAATFVAPASKSLIGATPVEMAGNGFVEKIHLQDRITFLKGVSDVWHARGEETLQFRMRRKGHTDKAWMCIEATLRAQISDNGAVM
ncbi:MAG: hypothetical protein ACR2PF_00635, partial [Rhizobiaceae bacterium]